MLQPRTDEFDDGEQLLPQCAADVHEELLVEAQNLLWRGQLPVATVVVVCIFSFFLTTLRFGFLASRI